MTTPLAAAPPAPRRPLRLWPGVAIVCLQWLTRFGLPIVWPDALELSVFVGLFAGLAVLVWWAFFSRAPMLDRWGAIVLMIVALAATSRLVHISIATGAMGFLLPIFAIPILALALVAGAVVSKDFRDGPRRATIAAAILLACGAFTVLRTEGITGDASAAFKWRWSETAEQRLLAQANDKAMALPLAPAAPPEPAPTATTPAQPVEAPSTTESAPPPALLATSIGWPGFRGPNRNSAVPGVQIVTDWKAKPPVEMWRRPVGPGWSSFAVRGNLLYTQEQRGEDEVVACYNIATGQPVWQHRDAARFWESNAGAGPRATPTLSAPGPGSRVYTFGATGIVNALDARNGAVVWSRNASSDTGAKVPDWGFASSPLLVNDLVVVAAAGKLAAYDTATGKPRWFGPDGRYGYSSPHPLRRDGIAQVLLMSGPGITSVAAEDGSRLWEYPLPPNARIVQPALTADGDLLVSEGEGHPMRRITVSHGADGWVVKERWSSTGLKPYFNDFVVHDGHAFGFDGGILACIDLNDGKRVWKGGRYGHGQLVLLPDQNLLLVLSEDGELALVPAAHDQFKELARFAALQGKTWNHPVLAGDVLLVRNSEEMAAFRLTPAGR